MSTQSLLREYKRSVKGLLMPTLVSIAFVENLNSKNDKWGQGGESGQTDVRRVG